jgi:hypothetical protein
VGSGWCKEQGLGINHASSEGDSGFPIHICKCIAAIIFKRKILFRMNIGYNVAAHINEQTIQRSTKDWSFGASRLKQLPVTKIASMST